MRIAFICMDTGVPVFGAKGCSVHVQEIVRGFARRGADVELFAARAGGLPPADFPPVRTQWFALPHSAEAVEREQLALALNAQVAQALGAAGRFDLVYERYSLWSFAAMEHAHAARIPAVLEVNAPLIEEQAQARGLTNRACAEDVAERVFAAADALLAVSKEVAAYLERFPAACGRIHVVPNGVDVDRIQPRHAPVHGTADTAFTIGFVGTLKPWHGVDMLVESFDLIYRSAPDARLLIVGSGPEERRLVDGLQRRKLMGAVQMTGAVAPSEVPAWLAKMDVAVAPAPAAGTFYFSPLKIFEYMSAGLPVVAANVGQIADVIRHEATGLLCERGDAPGMAAALTRLRCDRALRARLGAAARARVVESHTWDHTVARILELGGTAVTGRVSTGV